MIENTENSIRFKIRMHLKEFYKSQVLKIKEEIYSKDDLVDQVIQSKRFIDRKFADDLDLEKISGKAFLSKFHFIRIFKSYYGVTPHQYLISVRLENAKRLLRKDISISEVCEAVGFESNSSFSGLFKKYTGMSPSSYRTKWKKAILEK